MLLQFLSPEEYQKKEYGANARTLMVWLYGGTEVILSEEDAIEKINSLFSQGFNATDIEVLEARLWR